MNTRRSSVAFAGLMLAVVTVRAELMVGDPAPKLQVGQWIQGEPVTGFDTNRVYIVEFWATWCGPCVASIPHLNELWARLKPKGVIVIGVDVWDSDDAVAPFVKKMGDQMTYRVALDDKSDTTDGFMAEHWWKRKVNNHGIPCAFIIGKDGRIAWIGHPMGLKESLIDDVLSGHYDLSKAAAQYRTDLETNDKFQALQQELFSAIDQEKWDEADQVLKRISVLLPKFHGFAPTRLKVLLGQRKFEEACQLVDSYGQDHSADGAALNGMAWDIAIDGNADKRCLALAEKLATQAIRLTGGTNSEPVDTLARLQFRLGQKEEAIAAEEKAVNLESDLKRKQDLEKVLAGYREGKLPNAQ